MNLKKKTEKKMPRLRMKKKYQKITRLACMYTFIKSLLTIKKIGQLLHINFTVTFDLIAR